MTKNKRRPLTAHEIRTVAAEAICATETVVRYLSGLPVRSTSEFRIERALKTLGLDETMRPSAA